MKDFKTLRIWQTAHQLVLEIYLISSKFPKAEQFGLTSQLRRSVSSIAANIAEGCGRETEAELGRFLYIAIGSLSETEYHVLLARDLKIIDREKHDQLAVDMNQLKMMMISFIKKLKA